MSKRFTSQHMAKIQQASKDWHKADIVAKLRIAGTSLRKLSEANDLYPTALSVALQRDWPKAEVIIANVIGVPASEIWPTRYAKRKARAERAQLRAAKKSAIEANNAIVNQCSHDCNVCVAGGR